MKNNFFVILIILIYSNSTSIVKVIKEILGLADVI